jgi:hypothetical protein
MRVHVLACSVADTPLCADLTVAELGGQVPWPPLWHGLTTRSSSLRLILIDNLEENSFIDPF